MTGQGVGGIERRIDEKIVPYLQKLDLKSDTYLGISDLTVDTPIMVPSSSEVGVKLLSVQNTFDNYGVVRVYDSVEVNTSGKLILRSGSSLDIVKV